ncbi:hypothetical protein GCM10010172_85930 [Paractinoplanes ferrugineus]|uniref:non-specific serine/threonine protein kinase n=1 Tax=Paractinoplanes ferrugineus TaxID=113564 RepID=A0A919J8V8_9ACTN|nr:serine/threonine-protein kinase [Actinoplanes ferrugineus]GIE15193.1 hypothetical protein Afe05nite_70330 [Actinoplanes ferrugineus]
MEFFDGEHGGQWSYDPDARLGDPGAFGEVFEGTGSDGHPVAVKRIPLPWDVEGERRLREREVEIGQILADMPAQHVMRLLDVGRAGKDLLLVMPRATRSLAKAIREGDLDIPAGVEVIRQVAMGLSELAQASVAHRDLKPANVLQVDGVWKLADFGISRDLRVSTNRYTFRGQGTAEYKAPEIWAGRPATVKTDLYALGVLAFEVLSGHQPYVGTDEEQFARLHEQEPPPPLPDAVPSMVRRLVLRLLGKDPAQRPQDARAVVETLDNAVRRLEPQREALREAALAAQQRDTEKEATGAALKAKQALLGQQISQALADLRDVLEEAADQVREALPEAELDVRNGLDLELRCEQGRLVVEVWPQSAPDLEIPERDPLLLVGAVSAAPNATGPYANLVCEAHDGRLSWSVLRFTARSTPSRYDYGPRDRQHGFAWHVFQAQRQHMLRPSMHIWTMTSDPIGPDVIVDLLRQAITQT